MLFQDLVLHEATHSSSLRSLLLICTWWFIHVVINLMRRRYDKGKRRQSLLLVSVGEFRMAIQGGSIPCDVLLSHGTLLIECVRGVRVSLGHE